MKIMKLNFHVVEYGGRGNLRLGIRACDLKVRVEGREGHNKKV